MIDGVMVVHIRFHKTQLSVAEVAAVPNFWIGSIKIFSFLIAFIKRLIFFLYKRYFIGQNFTLFRESFGMNRRYILGTSLRILASAICIIQAIAISLPLITNV